MKLKIDRQILAEGLQRVAGAVEKRQTLAILANILIQADEQGVRLTGTDLEVELSCTVAHEGIEVAGEITVPARKLVDIVKSLPDGVVSIAVAESRMTIKVERSRFILASLPADDFPHVEEGVGTTELTLSCQVVAEMVERTQFSMAHQDVRYYLNGMYLEASDTTLRTVATDGHRLATVEFTGLSVAADFGVIIPRKGVLELGRLVAGRADEVQITIGSNHIRAEADGIRFTSKLVDGKFPDFRRVVPTDLDKEVVVDRAGFRQALQRAAILSNEKFRGVRLILEQDGLRLLSNNPEQEEAEVSVAAEVKGEGLEIGFNVQYLLDVLASCKSEQVRLSLGDVNSSLLMQEVDGTSAVYVVMPMRL